MKTFIITALLTCSLVAACSPAVAPTVPQGQGGLTTPLSPAANSSGGTLTVTSAAFTEGANIPKVYSCDGQSISPPLQWTGAPAQTASFALIVVDPDAPSGTFTHWVAFDIPANVTDIQEGAKNVGKAGQNGARRNGYTGPCPPSGSHRYIFNVYALDIASLDLSEGATRDQVENAIKGHILAQGALVGRYSRS